MAPTPRWIKCLICHTTLYPLRPRDWRACKCGTVHVTAGRAYVSYRKPS